MHDFLTFPDAGEEASGSLDGPFRQNVRAFVARCGRRVPPPAGGLAMPQTATWRVAFRIAGEEADSGGPPGAVELDVVEEDVGRSRKAYCDDCRVVGWSGHPVCRKRYHLFIRNNSIQLSCYQLTCPHCRARLDHSDLRCNSCNHEITVDDAEDWMDLQLEDTTHLLHGVVHSNGYGHILRLNGHEGGSKILRGCDLMGFWDRLCKFLRVRKVSVMDVSKKYGMEYRVLHAVTTGHSWYGDWGYHFGAGSFGVTADAYEKAVDTLSSMPLSRLLPHDRPPCTQLQSTIAFYRALSESPLRTARDLFRYLIQLLRDSHERKHYSNKPAWSKEDVMRAEDAIIKVLQAAGGSRWVTQRSLRGSTCRIVRSPELLDYCLSRLGGKLNDDGTVVAVRWNAESDAAIEYRLQANSCKPLPARCLNKPSACHLLCDMNLLYDALLNPATMQSCKPRLKWEYIRDAASKLLDCKQFVKHYDRTDDWRAPNPFAIRLWCHVELVGWPEDYTAPPPELLVVRATATVADLKSQVTKAFQETYLIFQSFQAEQLLVDGKGVDDDATQVKQVLGSNEIVRVRGRFMGGKEGLEQFRMERGVDEWMVDCACGAKDDDGERMLACDVCGVWQHTRCSGISDLDEVPAQFVCRLCRSSNKSTDSDSTISRDSTTFWEVPECSSVISHKRGKV